MNLKSKNIYTHYKGSCEHSVKHNVFIDVTVANTIKKKPMCCVIFHNLSSVIKLTLVLI